MRAHTDEMRDEETSMASSKYRQLLSIENASCKRQICSLNHILSTGNLAQKSPFRTVTGECATQMHFLSTEHAADLHVQGATATGKRFQERFAKPARSAVVD